MKICASAVSDSLDSQIDPRFGRCKFLIIVDPETSYFESVSNSASDAMRGAGIQAAQTVTNFNVDVVLTGDIGPKAFQALSASKVKIVTGVSGTVRDAVESYMKGELEDTKRPTVGDHFGIRKRRGGC